MVISEDGEDTVCKRGQGGQRRRLTGCEGYRGQETGHLAVRSSARNTSTGYIVCSPLLPDQIGPGPVWRFYIFTKKKDNSFFYIDD